MIRIELRDFMKWAFGEELVHVASGESRAWSIMAQMAALGTVIDSQGFGGGLPEIENVHPDAIIANEAVMLLAAENFSLPEAWNPFPDMDDPNGLIADCVAEVIDRRRFRLASDLNNNLIAMVISYAVMGRDPDWTAEQPAFPMVEKAGKPAWFVRSRHVTEDGRVYDHETDGYNTRAGRPKPGAYRKFSLDPRFQGAVQARIDWYLWSKAITRVAEHLQTGLKAHQIKPFAVDCEIWLDPPNVERPAQGLEIVAG
ncbi:MAG: hypothetical protein JWR80_7993 [Bradyrhizobium sp.]|nr:hypothetical protein [Bradyrhizobium sp.]